VLVHVASSNVPEKARLQGAVSVAKGRAHALTIRRELPQVPIFELFEIGHLGFVNGHSAAVPMFHTIR
jgi:hypothetical protein